MRNKLILFFVAIAAAATFGIVQLTAEAAPRCDKVNIVYCGLSGSSTQAQIDSLRSFYNKGVDNTNPHGHYSDLKAIFGWAGANQSMINSMNTSNTKRGTLYRSNGSIKVGDRVVGTNAAMAVRHSGGGTYSRLTSNAWQRSVSPSHNDHATYDVLVHFDKNGKADFAVAIDCANAVKFVPTTPPKKPAAACSNLQATRISNSEYKFSAKATASNGAKINSYSIDFGDGKTHNGGPTVSHTYAKPGSYTVKLTANTSVGAKTSNACVVKVTVEAPVYSCDSLSATKISRTEVKFATAYTAKNATYKGTEYVIRDADGNEIDRTTETTYTQTTPGDYSVQAYVSFNVDGSTKTVTSENCTANFTVPKPKVPAVSIQKTVDNVKYKKVGVDQEFTYQLVITNTGEVDLVDAVVTDDAPKGVTFLDSSDGTITDNKWTYTIPELKIGDSVEVTITAKVPAFLAGKIVNTACVDSPQVPGSPDDCDEATVEVPNCPVPGKEHLPEGSPECAETPPELPHTGMGDALLSLIGAGSLIGALSYYVASRRAL